MHTNRHSRHELFAQIGPEGQSRIEQARVAIVGCGAVGSHAAEMMTRAGAGRAGLLRLIDRDYVDLTNLQRQALFTEADARDHRPKSVAAAAHLREIDSSTNLQAVVRDLNAGNARQLIGDVDLILDGTDNFRSRFVINDAAVAEAKPWIYAGAVGSKGAVAFISPGRTPCLRCLLEAAPPLGTYESCDTAGIITPLAAAVAAAEVALALRWISAHDELPLGILSFDLWNGSWSRQFAGARPSPDCPSCGTHEFPALTEADSVAVLCGRNSVQLFTSAGADLAAASEKIERSARNLRRHRESVSAEIDEGLLTLFEDGRVIVEGTTDPLRARSIVARYLGG